MIFLIGAGSYLHKMAKRSARPKWVKGEKVKYKEEKPPKPMTFKKRKARQPRQNNT